MNSCCLVIISLKRCFWDDIVETIRFGFLSKTINQHMVQQIQWEKRTKCYRWEHLKVNWDGVLFFRNKFSKTKWIIAQCCFKMSSCPFISTPCFWRNQLCASKALKLKFSVSNWIDKKWIGKNPKLKYYVIWCKLTPFVTFPLKDQQRSIFLFTAAISHELILFEDSH